MSSKVLTRRYVNAFVNCFVEDKRLKALDELNAVGNSILQKLDLFNKLINPTIKLEDKNAVIKSLVDSKQLIITNFL